MDTSRTLSMEDLTISDVPASQRFDDSTTQESTFSFEWESNSSFDNSSSYSSFEEGAEGFGLFMSLTAQDLLKRCAASEGNLISTVQLQETSLRRSGSTSDTIQHGTVPSGMVFCIQTKLASTGTHNGDATTPQSPVDVLKNMYKSSGKLYIIKEGKSLQDFWKPWNTDGYTLELTDAVRKNDLDSIRQMYETNNHNLQCSNQFGESIVHTAARRGATEILRYMVREANVSLRVCCDNGRNPLHDACWSGSPNFECLQFLVEECPGFLLLTDTRGHTPLHYAPRDSWPVWKNFLDENQRSLLSP